MTTTQRRTHHVVAAVVGTALVSGVAAGPPASAQAPAAPPGAARVMTQTEPDPHWDVARCASGTYGTQSRRILFTNTKSTAETFTYWVDGLRLGTITLPPDSGPYRYSMPPVPSGPRHWQLTRNNTSHPSGTGAIIESPACPDDPPAPDWPSAGEGPAVGELFMDVRQPRCQAWFGGDVVTMVDYAVRNEDTSEDLAMSIAHNATPGRDEFVPAESGFLGRQGFEPDWDPRGSTAGSGLFGINPSGPNQQREWDVTIPSCERRFGISRNASVIKLGGWFTASVTRALPGERLTMTISGVKMRVKTADADGRAKLSVRIPSTWAVSSRTVKISGGLPNRSGTTSITTVR